MLCFSPESGFAFTPRQVREDFTYRDLLKLGYAQRIRARRRQRAEWEDAPSEN